MPHISILRCGKAPSPTKLVILERIPARRDESKDLRLHLLLSLLFPHSESNEDPLFYSLFPTP